MVKVRLARAGNKKRPFYHIVVADSQKARDGRFIERLGIYDPSRPIGEARIEHGRLAQWVENGAQPTERVAKIAKAHAKWVAAQGEAAGDEAGGAQASA